MFYENEKSFQRYEKKYLTDRDRMKEIVRVLKKGCTTLRASAPKEQARAPAGEGAW